MTTKWLKSSFEGVRFRLHQTRKNGVKFDQYFTIRYRVPTGKKNTKGRDITTVKEESLGWASEGWTAKKAFERASELKENRKTGEGPQTLAEKREETRAAKEAEQEKAEREGLTISTYFDETYFKWAEGNKAPNTTRSEKTLFDGWIRPVIGEVSMLRLAETDMERLKQHMMKAGKAVKTVHLTLALVRQIYNHAKRPDIYLLAKAKMPRIDNAKLRYLTAEEIETLLSELKEKSETVHDQALLAVNTGLRFSEVAGLQWEDVNYETGTLAIRDGKTGSRMVFFNDTVKKVLKARQGKKKTGLVFPIETGDKKGQRQEAVSKTFQREADRLFNKGVNDRRLRVSFHTLRHTFGSHVYGNTGDLYLTQKALGHKTMVMAQRYAKMNETRLREAFATMTNVLDQGKKAVRERKAKAGAGQVVNIRK